MNSDVVRDIMSRDAFEAKYTIEIEAWRGGADWASQVLAMREFCGQMTKMRWRSRAPMLGKSVLFEFEDERDAVLFKLHFVG